MKILLISDAHITRDWEVHLQELERLVSTVEYDLIISSGDEIHKPFAIGSVVEFNLIRYVEILSKNGTVPMYIVRGTLTHVGHFDESQAITKLFEKLNTTIISEPTIIGEVLFIPELYSKTRKQKALELVGNINVNVIVGHGTVEGFFNTGGNQVEELDSFEMDIPSAITFKPSDFEGKETFFGHYHIRTKKENFTYIGAFATNTFGEIDPNGKGVLVYDTLSKETEFIKRENDNQFIDVRIDTILDTVKLKKLISEAKNTNIKYRGVLMSNDQSILRALKIVSPRFVKRIEDESTELIAEEAIKTQDEFLTIFKEKGLLPCMKRFNEVFTKLEFEESQLDFLKTT